MSSSPQDSPTSASPPRWLAVLAAERQRTAYGLVGAGILLFAIPILLSYKFGAEHMAVAVWGAMLALIAIGAGIYHMQPRDSLADLDATRLLVLVAGGLAGFATALLGLALAWKFWPVLSGGRKTWFGPEGWIVWVVVLTHVAGLFVMFLSLQLGRSDERSNAWTRRLLYGYNAGLSGLLLFDVLLLVNLAPYIDDKVNPLRHLARRLDWTRTSLYSLSSKSENILSNLDRPTKVYVILPVNDFFYRQVQALLDNCQAVTDKLQVEYLSPDLNQDRVTELARDYKFSDRRGLLVVYGTGEKTDSQFIRYEALFEGGDMMPGARQQRAFKGEDAVLTAVDFLKEGKQKPVVYFTQGNGEPSISDAGFSEGPEQGAGILKQRLEGRNYTVKGLELVAVAGVKSKKPDVVSATKVPDDATMVAVIGPQNRLPNHAIAALRDYMEPPADANKKSADPKKPEEDKKPATEKKKGTMIVLLDVVVGPDGTMVQTGLEDFVRDFGVQVGNNRVFQSELQPRTSTLAVTNPNLARSNPVAFEFARLPFPFHGVRTVEPQQTGSRPGMDRYSAESLFLIPPRLGAWAETDLKTNQDQLYHQLMIKGERDKKISDTPLSIAVVVSENIPGTGTDPHAFMRGEQKPRLVVFGDATWATNRHMSERGAGAYYDLFSSLIAWLRERPASIGIEPKKSDVFVLDPSTNFSRMVFFPGLLAAVGILGLGTGVWIVRRK
ncbi:MAG TPA: Gldg family protein [Gemmataceae bacterium]|nr:Gldg family protein [Gemmataceae bacterium]